jgi:16S rRNA (cytidine1402-2'-O)-methyltransferase
MHAGFGETDDPVEIAQPEAAGPGEPAAPASGMGRLIIAAAPIGRAQDASASLLAALASAPLIAAEDTRRLRRLAAALGVTPGGRVISYYDEVEAARVPILLAALVAEAEREGSTRKEAIVRVAAQTGLRRREVYDAVVRAKSR